MDDWEQTKARTVPLIDKNEGKTIYSPALPRLALIGGALGAALFGFIGYALADGIIVISGLGYWASAGPGPATFAASAIGAALGGLTGGVIALFPGPGKNR